MTNLTLVKQHSLLSFFTLRKQRILAIVYDFPYFLTLQKKIYCVKMSKIVNLSEGRRFFYLTVRAILI